jgi:hypothetical protein
MSNPFSGIPDPGTPRPIRRRFQPGLVQEALRALKDTLRPAVPATQRALLKARWYSRDLWLQAKRHPRIVGAAGGAVALTLAGAIALHASGAGRSLCPPTGDLKRPAFLLLMDPVSSPVTAGSDMQIDYDVCGLSSGTRYSGRVRLVQQPATGKKKSARPKSLTVSFKDEVNGPASRRHRALDLGSMKPGTYTLELAVADGQGRERTKAQKVVVRR